MERVNEDRWLSTLSISLRVRRRHQAGLATIENLIMSSKSDAKKKPANNFMWYLLRADKLNDEDLKRRSSKSNKKGLVCRDKKCVERQTIRFNAKPQDKRLPENTLSNLLYVACYLMGSKDPQEDPQNPDSAETFISSK